MRLSLVKIFLHLIRLYQRFLSPILTSYFGLHCRYYPSCSEYTFSCLKEWGILKGLYLGIKRIFRCNPFYPGGYDPPPVKTELPHQERA